MNGEESKNKYWLSAAINSADTNPQPTIEAEHRAMREYIAGVVQWHQGSGKDHDCDYGWMHKEAKELLETIKEVDNA